MQFARAAVGKALIRSTPGGRELSEEMALLLVFVVDEGYELFPARWHAKPLGSELGTIPVRFDCAKQP